MIKYNFLTSFQKKLDKLDISTIKNILYQVIEENENIKTVFNSMKEAVLVLDDSMKVFFYNKMAIKVLEITAKNPVGLSIKEIIENDYFIKIIMETILKEEKLDDFEIMVDLKNAKYISLSIHPLVQNGRIVGNILIIDDITNEKENKNKLRQAESLAALTTISAGIAHEIKNPLGAMSIHVQLILDELNKGNINVSNDFLFSIKAVKEEIERLNNIVFDYLLTIRPIKAELMLTSLNSFLDGFVNFIYPELESKNIILEKKYSELPNVWLDDKYFRQALLNLVKNSISSIKENGRIIIEAYQDNNYAIINIIDNGEGIPEDIRHKIFDPYFTTKSFGTGLGLTIVYKIIKEHRGDISFKSKSGETVFSIKLPLSYIEKGQIEYNQGE